MLPKMDGAGLQGNPQTLLCPDFYADRQGETFDKVLVLKLGAAISLQSRLTQRGYAEL
jgi:hypothetical protein